MAAEEVVRSRDWGRGVVVTMAVFVITAATLFGLAVSLGNADVLTVGEGITLGLAFAAPMVATAVMALLGWQERPWLFVAAGIALLPMTLLTFSMLLFPLAVPAFVFFGVAVARPRLRAHPRAQPWAALLSAVLVLGAVANLFAGREVRTVSTSTSSATHEVFSTWSAAISIALVVAAIAIAALAPQDA